MNKKIFILVLVGVLVTALGSFSIALARKNNQAEKLNPINSCNTTITASGVYVLNRNLNCKVALYKAAIIIAADNVILDGRGFTISNNNSASDSSGIQLKNVSGVEIKNITVSGYTTGIYIINSNGNTEKPALGPGAFLQARALRQDILFVQAAERLNLRIHLLDAVQQAPGNLTGRNLLFRY